MALIDRMGNTPHALSELYRQQKLNQTQIDGQSNGVTDKTAGKEGQDEFVRSERSEEINRIKEQLNRLPDIDEQKVAELREQINNGSYNVDSQQVAAKILATEMRRSSRVS